MMGASRLLRRVLLYVLGLLFLAFAVAFSINSNLGISPINSLPYAISLVSGVRLGTCVTLVFSAYVLLQVALLRRRFRWYQLFQIAFSTLFGYLADFAKWALDGFCLPTYAGQLGMLAISIVLTAVGISLYVDTDLIPMPMEGMTLACAECFHVRFHNMKLLLDCLVVGLAVAISLLGLGRLEGVREGTVLAALLVGRVVAPIRRRTGPLVRRFCGLEEAA